MCPTSANNQETPGSTGIRTSALGYRNFRGVRASSIGIGAPREPGTERIDAIVFALTRGITVLDTAPYYHGGAHERCMGEAVRTALASGVSVRDSLIVSTKVGFIPDLVAPPLRGSDFATLRAHVQRHYVGASLMAWDEIARGCHSFSQRFITQCVQQSTAALGLDRIDCVFLDSPEAQLSISRGKRFAKCLSQAFETLESLCDAGTVGCYGIRTEERLDLPLLVELAKEVGGPAHRLAALQIPLSPLRDEMVASPFVVPARTYRSFVEAANDLGLYVYAYGCLDGGTPRYRFSSELEANLMQLDSDAAIALQWTRSSPWVGTALLGTRDPRHAASNLRSAEHPPLDPYAFSSSLETRP